MDRERWHEQDEAFTEVVTAWFKEVDAGEAQIQHGPEGQAENAARLKLVYSKITLSDPCDE